MGRDAVPAACSFFTEFYVVKLYLHFVSGAGPGKGSGVFPTFSWSPPPRKGPEPAPLKTFWRVGQRHSCRIHKPWSHREEAAGGEGGSGAVIQRRTQAA